MIFSGSTEDQWRVELRQVIVGERNNAETERNREGKKTGRDEKKKKERKEPYHERRTIQMVK